MNTPQKGPPRITDLRALPPGTIHVRVERVVEGCHERGGRREFAERCAPSELVAQLRKVPDGRYRISCLGTRGRYVKGGSCVVEIVKGEQTPRIVAARRSRDYHPSPSPAAALRHQTRRGARKLIELAQKTKDSELARAALERKHLNLEKALLVSLRRQQEDLLALKKRFEASERKQLAIGARQQQRQEALSLTVDALREALDDERARREAAEAQIAALEKRSSRLARRMKALESPPLAPVSTEAPQAVEQASLPEVQPTILAEVVAPEPPPARHPIIPASVFDRPTVQTEAKGRNWMRFLRGEGPKKQL